MASTTFSGPVTSTNGFVGAVTGDVTADTVTVVTLEATTITATDAVVASAPDNVFVIPDSDPGVTGAIWNDSGTLSISA
jgi:hypothetical protein